jgi:hypothetical protein
MGRESFMRMQRFKNDLVQIELVEHNTRQKRKGTRPFKCGQETMGCVVATYYSLFVAVLTFI